MAGTLGIYFGPKLISIVNNKGRKILSNINISRTTISDSQLEEKVPEEIKIVAVFNDELRRNNIEAREAVISLPGKDLIVRTFELPEMPAGELASAITFEAKKYIPFKIEELVSDFQVEFDRANRKNLVLFVGIKKDSLEKYLSILGQLNMKASYIDYSAFSVLRFIRLTGMGKKGLVAIIDADLREEDEVNFMVLENGFPVFSRDISLSSGPEGFATPEEAAAPKDAMAIDAGPGAAALEKLKTEIRVSLDYYHRKFPAKMITNLLFLTDKNYFSELEFFIQELGLPAQFVDTFKYAADISTFSLSLIKGYGAALNKVIKTGIKINLLAPRVIKTKAAVARPGMSAEEVTSMFSGMRLDFRVIIAGLLVFAATFGFGLSRIMPVKKDISDIIRARPQLEGVSATDSYEKLVATESGYKNRMEVFNGIITKQQVLTQIMDVVPRAIPKDIWLTGFNFAQKEKTMSCDLKGYAYLDDSDKELELANSFLLKLKESPTLNKYFKDIKIASLEQTQSGKLKVTSFVINCKK